MSKDKIEVNMNIYDIPILVEQLEKANKEIERLNSIINNDFSKICREKMIDKLSANEMILLQDKEIERLNNIIENAIKKLEYYNSGEALYYVPMQNIIDILKGDDK